jgi:8-oxo-dGTP pyrophosphatase MutT (NUDIX family)
MAIELNLETVHTPPRDAATVMVLRDAPGGPGVEVLMLRRHANSGVLGGAYVYPGGKLDADDHALAQAVGDAHSGEAALRVAALRETFEECGLWLARGPVAAPALAQARAAHAAQESFGAVVGSSGLALEPDALTPWARWITPKTPSVMNKRFDTRFFAALAPAGQQARHDNHEATEALWLRPREGLSRYWDGAIDLAPPQIMTLMELARFARAADALAYAAARAVPIIEPEPFDMDGTRTICYPGDERHSLRTPAWVGPSRLSYRNRRFEPRGGLADLLVGAL